MSLSSYKAMSSVAVSDIDRAREFYEGKLGLSGVEDQENGSWVYACGGDTSLHVYPSLATAGKAPATVTARNVDDLEQMVDELASGSVKFERYDDSEIKTDEKGIFASVDLKVAWFKDPDGNTFAIEQE